MPRYRLAVFDFDGTLADSFPWFLDVVNQVADRFRFRRIEDAEVETLRGWHARQIIEHLGMPAWKLPLVARDMRRRMAADIGRISLFPGAEEMLRRLAERGVALAIVTSNSAENVRRVLGPRNAALIRHYGCGASIFGKRPKLRRVLRESGVAPAEAICIGDELRDLHAARAERLAFGAVGGGYTALPALAAHAPEALFTRAEEISELLAPGGPRVGSAGPG
jgi:phosphoglycolate phosphatase